MGRVAHFLRKACPYYTRQRQVKTAANSLFLFGNARLIAE